MTTLNLFQRLRELVPLPPVLVGKVLEHHSDDTSTVEIPGALPVKGYAGNVATGSLIRPRGTTVPVGKNAFVRAGVIETQAPDGTAEPLPIGRVIVPPPPIPEVHWVIQASASDKNWSSVAAGPSLYVAVYGDGLASTSNVMTSPDGATWTMRSNPSNSTYWAAVMWDTRNSQFVAVGFRSGTNDVMTSPDGLTWTLWSSGI